MSTVLRIKLMEREKSGNPIKVGVIGAGLFGSLTVSQLTKIPGINVSIISDILKEKAIRAYEKAGYKDGEIVQVNDPDKANRYIKKKIPVITDNNQVLIESAVDVILEATGNLEAGAKNAYNAIQDRKNIVMATVETDVTVGAILEKMAEESDVVYSMAYGDQPALIIEL